MKKSVIPLMVLVALFSACGKEIGQNISHEERPRVSVIVAAQDQTDSTSNGGSDGTGGGQPGSQNETLTAEVNEHTVYSFMGISGTYFGCTSSFKTGNETLEFIFGTNLTQSIVFTQEEFEELIRPGERQFGSLGAFTSYPERVSGKVEIAYTDRHGRRWCTTEIEEKHHGRDVETKVHVNQNNGFFILEDAHKFEIAAETEGYRLKGRFECTLYEVNGNAKKKIKGTFTGVVAPK
jgi:hypothetical protein